MSSASTISALQGVSPLTVTANFGIGAIVTVPSGSTTNVAIFAFLTDAPTNSCATHTNSSNWNGLAMWILASPV